jgi:HSP20 family protein
MRSLIRYTDPRSASLLPSFDFVGRSPWLGIENELDRLFDTTLSGFVAPMSASDFPIDVYEDKDNTYVRAELPGVNREDIKVEMVDGFLNINASRKGLQVDGKGEETFSLRRSVNVPQNVAGDKVGAGYENGVLTVTLPKEEEARPRKIAINVQ